MTALPLTGRTGLPSTGHGLACELWNIMEVTLGHIWTFRRMARFFVVCLFVFVLLGFLLDFLCK